MDQSFWLGQLTKAQALADAIDTAITGLTLGTIQSYTLDTGQSRQTVTKVDLAALAAMQDQVNNRITTLEARLYGCGTVIAGPAF